MRTDLQLIQSAVASEDLTMDDIDRIIKTESKFISLYSVTLPEKFKGLPSVWFFGILKEQHAIDDDKEKLIFDEAGSLIRDFINAKEIPVVFISDDQRIQFKDQLTFKEQPVFFLDRVELLGKDNYAKTAKEAPILLSAKRKFKASGALHHLSPYLPNKPVNDWRFFGRKKEIKEIVESQSNCFVIGARRIGKTSLLQEVRRHLLKKGETVHWIECQYKEKIQDVVEDIAQKLSARDHYQIQERGKSADFSYIASVIKRLKADKKSIVLFLDEIGNVISKNLNNDSWRFIGALRELTHNNEVRVIASAFQEVIIKQLKNFEGPFVNFGTTTKINAFSKNEIEELLIAPLNFWGRIKDKKDFAKKIKNSFGSHPLILQYLGKWLFDLAVNDEKKFIDDFIDDFIDNFFVTDRLNYFDSAIGDIYFKIDSYLERYVFLKICMNIDADQKELANAEINQGVLKSIFEEIGIESDFDIRILFLDRLSLRGLMSQDSSNKTIYKIDSPIIYLYLKKFHPPLEELAANYLAEIKIKKLTLSDF